MQKTGVKIYQKFPQLIVGIDKIKYQIRHNKIV